MECIMEKSDIKTSKCDIGDSCVLSVCHMSRAQGPFYKCAWIDDDLKMDLIGI